MIYSMTGFAGATRDIGRAVIALELRSVNSRYLDLAFRIVEDLRALEPQLREMISAKVSRGKVECRVNLIPVPGLPQGAAPNRSLMSQLREWQAMVREAHPEAAPLSVAEVLRWPGMFGESTPDHEVLQAACLELARGALDDFLATRAREGEKLAATLLARIAAMRQLVAEVAPKIPGVLAEYQERLATRLREVLASAEEERIRQEMGLFAARIDVAEELTRLTTHLTEAERVLAKGGAVGKRLDFIMQELNREANTLASKSMSAEITSIAVELKLLIEQMREQVQNLE